MTKLLHFPELCNDKGTCVFMYSDADGILALLDLSFSMFTFDGEMHAGEQYSTRFV
mgnify:CR=1 FL=1